jgi:hypothetical protein
MNGALDGALVSLALAVSVGYAVGALGPRTLRRRLLSALAASMLRLPAATRLHPLARRLQSAASAEAGACGGCDDCGAAPPKQPTAGPPEPGTQAEIRVPLSSIGKRR